MPGSGKTTLGRRLAAHFALPFLDLDAAIEARAGRRIPAIFAAEGEAYFRQLEAATLREVMAPQPGGPLVLATGGGTPCFHENMGVLQAAGLTLWLDVPVRVLASRLQASDLTSRPLLAGRLGSKEGVGMGTAPGAGRPSPTPPAPADALETRLRETLAARRRFYALARLRLPGAKLASALALLAAAGYGAVPPAAAYS